MSSSQDELLSQFKDVTGSTDERARFYLESANWTLQLAISSFYEHQPEMAENMNVEEESAINMEDSSEGAAEASGIENIPELEAGQSQPAAAAHWPKKTPKPKVATLHNMSQQLSDDEEEGEAFYAGGSETSGQQVLGPPKRRNFREQLTDMFKMAHESEAAEHGHQSTSRDSGWGVGLRLGQTENDHEVISQGSRSSQSQAIQPVILKLWSQGFSINDGELRPYDDPQNKEFLETVMKGQIPNELRQMGSMVSVDVEDHRHEDFKKLVKKVKNFKGSGHTLGSPAPDFEGAVAEETPKTPEESKTSLESEKTAIETLKLNSNQPTTMIQVRLADGTRISGQFNLSHTVDDIRQYIINARPQYVSRNFLLVTSFPTKELAEGTDSIEKAGIQNACLMQRLS